jgi:AcrR family transcriptional regulator
MGRTALSAEDRTAFREAVREVATRRFAEHGEAGVTMRGLAEELGCSPMTPYKYFADRDEIFTMVRLAAIDAFVAAQHACDGVADPVERLRARGRAYVGFAIEHPDQYRVMFQLDRNGKREPAEIAKQDRRTWGPLYDDLTAAIAAGDFTGDPAELAHAFWAVVHGLATLHLAGKLQRGRDHASLVEPTLDLLVAGARSATKPPRRRTR